jgi:hypothetical protein
MSFRNWKQTAAIMKRLIRMVTPPHVARVILLSGNGTMSLGPCGKEEVDAVSVHSK